MKVTGTLSRLGAFLGRAWLGVITAIIWLGIGGAGFATVLNGSGETGGDLLIVAGYTLASMTWGGLVVWSFRREPMRRIAGDIRDGQKRILDKFDEQEAADPPAESSPLALVRPLRRD